MAAFAELGCCQELVRSVEELGWLLPTPVQQEAVPLVLGGGDVMAAAETGSGKTGAFALPILQVAHEALRQAEMQAKGTGGGKAPPPPTPGAAAVDGISDDRDGLLQVGADGLSATCGTASAWAGGRAAVGVLRGAYHFEVEQTGAGGLCRFGWSTTAAKLALGTDKHGFGYGGTGKKSHGNQFDSYGGAYGAGDVLGCTLDRAAGTISYSKNGQSLGVAFKLPAALARDALYPAICLKGCSVRLNFGERGFAHPPPAGAAPLAAASAADIVRAAAASDADAGSSSGGGGNRAPTAVILEPTRDLAEQVHECIVQFAEYFREPPLKAALLVGGADAAPQVRALRDGVDVVSGTPGRVLDLVKSGKLRLGEVQFFVLDEADRLLDTGNLETILALHGRLPKRGRTGGRLQTLLFSATLHTPEVRQLAERITEHPILVDLKGKEHVPETVHHVLVRADPHADASWATPPLPVPTDDVHKGDGKVAPPLKTAEAASEATKRLKPLLLLEVVERLQMQQCLIFCRTNLDCDNLEKFLNAKGGGKAYRGKAEKGVENEYSCVVFAGQRHNDERRRNLKAFKEGDVRFLICTDVAARGIDIKELPYVINMTLPDKEEDYLHRIGRVGRAETMGLAISIVATQNEKVWYYDKRKWEGKQLSTKLASAGGCCIWYDEPALLKGVEKRLGAQIESLDAFVARQPKGGGGTSQFGATYGQAKDGGLNEQTSAHLEQLAPAVSELAALEVRAQKAFLLGIKRELGGDGAKPKEGSAAVAVAAAPAAAAAPGASRGGGGGRGHGKQRRGRG